MILIVYKTLKQLIMTTLKTFLLKRKALVLFTSCLMFFSCSSDDSSDDDNGNGPSIDFSEISGEYSGTASSTAGSDDISMRIRPRSTEGEYSVEFFGFSNLTPCCNSANRPDGVGSLTVENDELSFDITWNSDSPQCSGKYTGTDGTFKTGNIVIEMNVDLNCVDNEVTETFNLTKTADL